ncbi:unnamed protein product [Pipistrellus nathusii]|uniref:Uncharacterized protein n=1 Tax=Pipistrellus nathusii TaxID=59473 RepID=A0ABP0AI57_PIPNA
MSAPWHRFSKSGVRAAGETEQVTSKPSSLASRAYRGPGLLSWQVGRGGGQAGGHLSGPSLRNGTHPCTCTPVPHASMHSPPRGLWEKARSPKGSEHSGGAVEPPGEARPAPEPLTQQ